MTVFRPRVLSPRVEPLTSTTGSVPLALKRASVTFDATWSPYIQGTIVATRQTAAATTATDPRKAMCAKFTLQQQVDDGALQQLAMTAYLRSRVTDFTADETTLTFASIESMMQDHADIGGQQYSAATTDTNMNADAVSRMQLFNNGTLTINNDNGPANFSVAAADAGWDAGVSIWDAMNTYESQKSIWLRGDETGRVLFRNAIGYSAITDIYYLNRNRITNVTDTVDRGEPNFADSVFINYVYNKGQSTATDYGVVGSPTFYKMLVINRQGKRVATGEAQARAQRMVKRGRTLTVTGPWDLSLRPNRPIYVAYQDVSWYGTLRAVTFRHPEGLMDLTIDVTESQS